MRTSFAAGYLSALVLLAGCAGGAPDRGGAEASAGVDDPRSFKKVLQLETVPQSEDTQDYSADFALYQSRGHFKAFATSRGGPDEAFGFGSSWNNGTVSEAVSTALKRCREKIRFGNCALYSLGDILVAGMSAEQLERAKAAYVADPDATNDDL